MLGAGAITQHPLIAFLAHCRRAGRVADRNPFHPGTCPVTLWEADKPRSLRSSRRPCIRPFHQHPNRRQAKSSASVLAARQSSLPASFRLPQWRYRYEGEGRTFSLLKVQEVADGGYRAQVILVSSSTHPLYLCRLLLSPGRSSRRQPHEQQIPRRQKAAAGLIRGQLNAYSCRKRSWAKLGARRGTRMQNEQSA